MSLWIKARLSFLWRALWRPRRRAFMLLWVALSTWDLLVAQLLPPEWANKSPRVYDALVAMSGWLPWWTWALIGLGILLAVSIEYGVRQKYKANLDEWRQVDPLEIWRAGCLWKGHKPHYPIPFLDPAYPSFIRLVNAAKMGQLILAQSGAKVDAQSLVNRSELARFARSKGEMPEFLKEDDNEPKSKVAIYNPTITYNIYHRNSGARETVIESSDKSYFDKSNTFVKFRASGEILDSKNISSITDNGVGDYTVNFVAPLNKETLVCHPTGTGPRNFRIIEVSSNAVRLKFDERMPEIISLKFED